MGRLLVLLPCLDGSQRPWGHHGETVNGVSSLYIYTPNRGAVLVACGNRKPVRPLWSVRHAATYQKNRVAAAFGAGGVNRDQKIA